jgi:hypothetical protein
VLSLSTVLDYLFYLVFNFIDFVFQGFDFVEICIEAIDVEFVVDLAGIFCCLSMVGLSLLVELYLCLIDLELFVQIAELVE